jgi:hypothetical protein
MNSISFILKSCEREIRIDVKDNQHIHVMWAVLISNGVFIGISVYHVLFKELPVVMTRHANPSSKSVI